MEFCRLTKEEYRAFYDGCPQSSFMQSVQMAQMKEETGSRIHFVGVKQGDQIVAGAMIQEERIQLGLRRFYAPRGLLVDYHDKELLAFFVKNLKDYVRKQGGLMLIIDPNVVYRVRTSEGDIIPEEPSDDQTVKNLQELGFIHHGFNTYLDAMQVRWCCRLPLDAPYEEKKAAFSKQTRKNINTCIKKGLMVREGTMEDVSVMAEIFDDTARRRDFLCRGLDYYQCMYRHMSDLMTIYIAYLEPSAYLSHAKQLLEDAQKNYAATQEKIEKHGQTDKLERMLKEAGEQIDKYRFEVEKAETFAKEYPNGKNVGCLLSLRSGREYLTFLSGVLQEYRSFNPKYLMYEHHIQEAYKEGFDYCNFYGITGDFRPENPLYGVFEFKKGFKGNVTEYVGQFELPIGRFYPIYTLLKKIKHLGR